MAPLTLSSNIGIVILLVGETRVFFRWTLKH